MYRSRFFRLAVFAPLIALLFWPSPVSAQTFTSSFDSLDGWTVEQNGGNGVFANGALRFSYQTGLISRTFLIENPSTVSLSIDVTNNDTNSVGWSAAIADTYTVSLGSSSVTSSEIHTSRTVGLTTVTTEPNALVTVSLSGIDNGFWAGWYGPVMDNLLITVSPVIPENSVWIELDEGWSGELSAPEGSVFESVLFASYGNPSGSNGNYSLGWCNAQNSVQIIEELLIGQTSATLDASNGVFGDPCGGTYKRLYVLASFTQSVATTTTTTIPQTTTTEPETTTTTVVEIPNLPPVDTEEPVETPPSQSDTESDEPSTSVPQYAEEQTPSTEEVTTAEAAIAEIDTTEVSAEELADAVSTVLDNVASAEELGNVVNDLLDKPLSDEQFSAVIDEVFSQDLSTEELTNVLEAVFDESLSDEKFEEVISTVLEQPLSDEEFAAVVDILESDTVSEEQVAAAVDTVLETGVTEDQATELATSAKVLESIDADQATEIFAAVDISEVTLEEAAQIVDAVQEAPTEVRDAFEEEINVFEGAVDTYVPLGSSVPVSTRRVIIAMGAVVIFSAPVPTSRR